MQKKTKYILIGLGVVAVGTGAYMYYQFLQKKKKNTAAEFKAAITSNTTALPSITTSSTSSGGSTSSGFPLKRGSRGTLVTSLQNALIKKYGASILPKYGADGGFGSETVNALQSKGLPTTVDSDTFTKIVLSTGSSTSSSSSSTTSSSISKLLHSGISKDNFSTVISALKKIKNVSKYSAVNTIFKKTRIGYVRKTMVTALLDKFQSTSEKKKLNEQFYRIGLKYDGSKWSLSGILGGMIDQLVTIERAKIWDASGKSLEVPSDTILGEYLDANNGVTEFETLDRRRLFVKTTSIRYAS